MKRSALRICCLVLAVVVTGGLFTGCGGTSTSLSEAGGSQDTLQSAAQDTSAGTSAQEEKPDISRKVEVICYLAGDASPDSDLVNGELNKLFEKDLNCTVKFINIPWADWETKYPLIQTAGEVYDMIYASNWAGYADYAQKGAYMELDGLLEKYAPDVWKQVPEEGWEAVRINGKIMGIPSVQKNYVTDAICIRGDLREKLGVPEVKDIDSLEVYLDAVKKNVPDMIPFNIGSGDTLLFPSTCSYDYVIDDSNLKIYTPSYTDLSKADYLPLLPEFPEFSQRVKKWYDTGYFPKGLLTNKEYSYNAFVDGKSAVAIGNMGAICENAIYNTTMAHPEWKPEFVEFRLLTKAGVHPMAWMADGMAIGRNSKNPERALLVINKIRSDRTCYDLLFNGMLGRNYTLTEDGRRMDPEGVTSDKNGYLPGNQGQWGFTYEPFTRVSVTEWKQKREVIYPMLDVIATPDVVANFAFVRDSVQTEIAAVSQIIQQYSLPLMWGITKDPVKDIETLRTKMKSVGSDKILEEVKKQCEEYLKK